MVDLEFFCRSPKVFNILGKIKNEQQEDAKSNIVSRTCAKVQFLFRKVYETIFLLYGTSKSIECGAIKGTIFYLKVHCF